MAINETTLKKLIKKNKLVNDSDLQSALKVANHVGCSIIDVLLGRDILKEEELGKILSEHYKCDYVDLGKREIDISTLKIIPEEFAQNYGVVAFKKTNGTVHIAVEDPQDLELLELTKKTIGNVKKITPHVTTKSGINNSLKLYNSRLAKDVDESEIELTEASPVNILEKLLEDAVQEEASDIHIEALEDRLLVRFRVDGVLHDEKIYDKSLHAPIIARLKILSDLKLDETRLPQDGQFSMVTKRNKKVSFRVSIIPSVTGQKAVLRVLESALTRFNIEELGLLPEDQEVVSKALDRTHGMFLVTGPTGSGKTTTLYTSLGLLNSPEVNIITIEDPVENKIKRINQIQVNTQIDLTFAKGLRSVLRQDPDIVMVGEIRDRETAVIATNAAMTGHLVFSTVHANTAAGAIPRMIDLGVEPFLLASTLNLVIAQRLVRVLCPKCKKLAPPNPVVKEKLEESKDRISKDILKMLNEYYEPVGCNACHNTGFKGRIGIFELIHLDSEIKEMITRKSSADELENTLRKRGVKTMLEDGVIKVAKGLTTLDEVFRVISE